MLILLECFVTPSRPENCALQIIMVIDYPKFSTPSLQKGLPILYESVWVAPFLLKHLSLLQPFDYLPDF